MVVRNDFWRGKRVFVTGHTGFKGGWISLWLESLGAQVAGYALAPPTEPSFFELTTLRDRMHSIQGDIRDVRQLSDALTAFRPEIVFHMAAQPLVRRSYVDPVETYSTNVMGTVHLLEAVRECLATRAVIVVTSDKCYANRESRAGYKETDPMGGHDPYSSSKGCAELVTHALRASFFSDPIDGRKVGVASVRAGNVIGGGDWATDRIVPDFVRAATARKPLRVRRPSAVRPWQHVLEPLNGYLTLAEKLYLDPDRYSEGWNFGPNESDEVPVSRVVDSLVAAWGAGAAWELDGGPHPHEAGYLKLNCSKARSRLDWKPRLKLDDAIQWTACWYREHQSGNDLLAFSLRQIKAYESLSQL